MKESSELIEQKSREVKAPQAIVHIKHSITLQQYKVWLVVLQKFREHYERGDVLGDDGFYRFPKSELDEIIGYELPKDRIEKDLIALRKEDIIISVLEKGGEKAIEGMGFISRWKLTSKTVAIEIPPFLQDVMKGLDKPKAMFQLLNWQIFNHFSGKHEAIIYKLCRDYIGARNTPYMTVDEFRSYMGIKKDEYQPFMKLNEWVIKKPIQKINESTVSDISIEVNFRKAGRKTLGLYFVVTRKNQTSIPFPETEENPAFQFAKVRIEPTTQIEYLAQRQADEIGLCIERANEYGEGEAAKGKTPNYGAIYRKAISEGWHISYADKKAKQEQIEGAKRKATKDANEADKAKAQKDLELAKWIEETLAKFDDLEPVRKAELMATYAAGLTDIVRPSFQKHGEKSKMHRFGFAQFIEQQLNN
jgi:plasmid replication initiation protein